VTERNELTAAKGRAECVNAVPKGSVAEIHGEKDGKRKKRKEAIGRQRDGVTDGARKV